MTMPALEDLRALGREDLSKAWQALHGKAPPPRMSQVFMRRVLAYEIQVQHHGGLSKAALKDLAQKDGKKKQSSQTGPGLKPGGRLLREWNGITNVVDVTEDGFLWGGETYRSLSVIARTITGSHWSGPRFFGLTKTGGNK